MFENYNKYRDTLTEYNW